ncbi:MAG: acyl-CoA/acyl-ACP dehydrogenase [Desulfobacterales bacterium]|nr:acyl-CoA/acyl-ACP dehydrogenase [Desulfobacterales bacterium]
METLNVKEIKAYHEMAARFTKNEIKPEALDYDRFPFADFNQAIIDKLASNEFLVPTLPEKFGGPGSGMRVLGIMLEELSKEDASMGLIILIQSLAYKVLSELGTKTLMNKFSAMPEKGNPDLLALPIYADPEDLPKTVTAVTKKNGFTLNGSLEYIPLLPNATAAIIPATIDDQDRIDLFVLPLKAKGVTISEPVVSLGLRGCPVADLTLENVHIPKSNRLKGKAPEKMYASIAEKFRGPVAAMSLGILKGAYLAARNYAKDRYQAKKQIIEHHMVRRMLSEMVSWIDVASLSVEQACILADNGNKDSRTRLLSVQKVVTQKVSRATDDAVQVLGGYGYMHEYGQEKKMRDAKQVQGIFGSNPIKTMRIIERDISK